MKITDQLDKDESFKVDMIIPLDQVGQENNSNDDECADDIFCLPQEVQPLVVEFVRQQVSPDDLFDFHSLWPIIYENSN